MFRSIYVPPFIHKVCDPMFICNPGANLSMEGNNNTVKLFRGRGWRVKWFIWVL